jgi:hypothetical protein
MGKVTSLYGKTTGKIGSIVFSTSGGETIAREYNPHVANPNTQAQVNQRARMKLMSQLSASLSPVIAMQKEGLISKRNKFVKRNFANSYASQGVAQISYENVQLTEGNSALPQIIGQFKQRDDGTWAMNAFLLEPAKNISRVVWCLFVKTDDGNLSLEETQIVSQREADNGGCYFPVYWEAISGDSTQGADRNYVIYAYAMSDTSERATAQYGNLNVSSATDLARLISTRTINFTDYLFSQTRGVSWNRGEISISAVADGKARVFVTALGQGGSVSGAGTFDVGTEVTVVATPASGWTFKNWLYNGTSIVASTSASYTFTLNEQTDLIAVFEAESHEGL